MSKDYFRFKQFTIFQDQCAMKVTTLACIQGAWLPDISPKNVLDIGAGTGLLTLMSAQEFDCKIDAVEIDSDAYAQMKENVANSTWFNRITCHHDDIKNFALLNNKYDFIISNPPFFENQLKSSKNKINKAKHESGIKMNDLVDAISNLLSNDGKVSILLPPYETTGMIELCKSKLLYPDKQLIICDSEKKDPKCIVTILSKKPKKIKISRLIIKRSDGFYTDQFKSLLKEFYLYL